MKIGIPKEIKNQEARVAMTPEGVKKLVRSDNTVVVEFNAGVGSGFPDEEYQQAGAKLVSVDETWKVELVVKVKEPQPSEYQYIDKQIIFTFFHLAGVEKSLTLELVNKGATALAYESLEDDKGQLPILQPMSAIAGNMSVLMGAYYLARFNQGNGMQLGTVLNKPYGKVVILGDGIVGQHAAKVASAMGAEVALAGLDSKKWLNQNHTLLPTIKYFQSTKENISREIKNADLVVGAVLLRGAKSPKILSEDMIKTMQPGSVIVDVSIDQGGCFETSRPTTHSNPTFIQHGVIHYCVSNMPGAYPKAATLALTDITFDYVQELANNTLKHFISHTGKRKAVNIFQGQIVTKKVAMDLELMNLYHPLNELSLP